jgi:threonyl-tRNA synthetase
VRHITQDDAHIFCTEEQIEDEIFGCLDYAKFDLYDLFGLERALELSTRPGEALGTDEEWDFTEGALARARAARARVRVNEGDGAFYGPKIDLHMTDSLGRSWQMGTIQLDYPDAGALRPDLHGRRQRRAHAGVIHRALLGLVRALHRHPDRALRRRVPVLARAGAGRCCRFRRRLPITRGRSTSA